MSIEHLITILLIVYVHHDFIFQTLIFFLSVAIIACSSCKTVYTIFFLTNKKTNKDCCLYTYIMVLMFWMEGKRSRQGIKINRKTPYLLHFSKTDSNNSMQLSGLFMNKTFLLPKYTMLDSIVVCIFFFKIF